MAALFATGLSGIVAEYVLATLATYFLGDSVFQWTMVLSLMLFSMGLGSRLSRHFEHHLLETFIAIELVLSILISFCAIVAYLAMPFTSSLWLILYLLSILIGLELTLLLLTIVGLILIIRIAMNCWLKPTL